MNQRFNDALKHGPGLLKHIVIPEANHAKPTMRENPRSIQIVEQVVRMLSPIDFYDQACADADEINDVLANRLLSPEAVVAEMPVAEVAPEATFGV